LDEFERTRHYPKLQKYLKPERVAATIELINAKANVVSILYRTADFIDSKDNYLLDLCQTVLADYLVTGDKPPVSFGIF
jgi:putative PIN family toxin of toxin-antitoxin system